ncbi:hypothetical protein FNV43_RR16255 [Rhamnella rubrinervis]|uniref:Transmembrane protein n=1 Tax=Rhamnella rubrinervis TaxID=2594499 RepID=A0A8K0EAB5_9ROSA|nr:hypothetical protein FNV43_RR16255 [Rhamnella rubrinervis]
MEALWNLEDKWKLSTQEAALLLVCAAFGVTGLCTATMVLRNKSKRKQQLVRQETNGEALGKECSELPMKCGWESMKAALMGSVRWSRASKWDERRGGSWRETPLPLLEKGISNSVEFDVRWQSHNSESPVWQRPILMGEKCELPRFSGLILYDERGQPLRDHHKENSCNIITNKEETVAAVRKTLRDLL